METRNLPMRQRKGKTLRWNDARRCYDIPSKTSWMRFTNASGSTPILPSASASSLRASRMFAANLIVCVWLRVGTDVASFAPVGVLPSLVRRFASM